IAGLAPLAVRMAYLCGGWATWGAPITPRIGPGRKGGGPRDAQAGPGTREGRARPAPRRGSPDAHPVFGRDPERIALGHPEGLVPGVDVAQRRERADVPRRVRAVDQLLAQRVVAPQRAPDLRPAHEEALLAGEAVDHRRLLPAERAAVGFQRNGQAAQVADVLAHRHLRVDVHAGQLGELVGGVLRAELR